MYDAIIIGARCAGSPTAMLLAQKGYKVLLVDKTGFPSDTPSTHFLWHAGVARLKHWGLLDQYESTVQRASLKPPPPELIKLFAAFSRNRAETDRFFGTDAGTVSMQEFFAPESLRRIITSS